ncbi:hypothetical protein GCM10018954_074290 [Kutzneria kofuensis]
MPAGQALEAAVGLAEQLSAFPQTCLRNDRLSTRNQHGLSEVDALAQELSYGKESLATDALAGAGRFAAGAGRHGEF